MWTNQPRCTRRLPWSIGQKHDSLALHSCPVGTDWMGLRMVQRDLAWNSSGGGDSVVRSTGIPAYERVYPPLSRGRCFAMACRSIVRRTIAAGIGAASHRISLQFRLRRPPASVSSGDMPSRSSRKQCRHDGLLRLFGAVWIILGLIAFVMATISTVKSDAAYRFQLVLFSAVALLALVGGVGAIFRRVWAAYILLTLSWIAALYFFGSALAMALWPLFPDSEARFHPLLFLISSGIAVQGLPFLWMALFMRRCVKVSEVKSEPT